MARFKSRHAVKKKRVDWKKKFKSERNKVLDEAIVNIKHKLREAPRGWERGYNSAITALELMKDSGS